VNAHPGPTAAISKPAIAGPVSLASWKLPMFNDTAFRIRSDGTITPTKLCLAGLSITVANPRPSAIR